MTGWNVIPCEQAHPDRTCAEYERWLDWIEQQGGDFYVDDGPVDELFAAFEQATARDDRDGAAVKL